jgi:hypothetical protein
VLTAEPTLQHCQARHQSTHTPVPPPIIGAIPPDHPLHPSAPPTHVPGKSHSAYAPHTSPELIIPADLIFGKEKGLPSTAVNSPISMWPPEQLPATATVSHSYTTHHDRNHSAYKPCKAAATVLLHLQDVSRCTKPPCTAPHKWGATSSRSACGHWDAAQRLRQQCAVHHPIQHNTEHSCRKPACGPSPQGAPSAHSQQRCDGQQRHYAHNLVAGQ